MLDLPLSTVMAPAMPDHREAEKRLPSTWAEPVEMPRAESQALPFITANPTASDRTPVAVASKCPERRAAFDELILGRE